VTDTSKPGPRTKAPKHVHPLVELIFKEMAWQELSRPKLARLAGIAENTIQNWRRCATPNLQNVEACLNVLGYELTVTQKEKV
jgi:hypothetical protein